MNANAKDQEPTVKKVKPPINSDISKTVGRNIRLIREQHKIPLQEMARIIGVSYQQLQKYESGKNRIPMERLLVIKELFHVPYEYFLYEYGDTSQKSTPEDMALSTYILKKIKKIKPYNERQKILKIVDILCS